MGLISLAGIEMAQISIDGINLNLLDPRGQNLDLDIAALIVTIQYYTCSCMRLSIVLGWTANKEYFVSRYIGSKLWIIGSYMGCQL
jgi:hypothetical protein